MSTCNVQKTTAIKAGCPYLNITAFSNTEASCLRV